MSHPKSKIKNRKCRRSGFTLIECALVTVIVGVGVLAIVQAQQAYHQQNAYSARLGAGLALANEIRELTLNMPRNDPISGPYGGPGPESNEAIADPYEGFLPYDDLDDFAGFDTAATPIGGPIDALGRKLPAMEGWSQVVSVEKVSEQDISGDPLPDSIVDYAMMRITCRVLYRGPNDDAATEVTRLTWVRSGY